MHGGTSEQRATAPYVLARLREVEERERMRANCTVEGIIWP